MNVQGHLRRFCSAANVKNRPLLPFVTGVVIGLIKPNAEIVSAITRELIL